MAAPLILSRYRLLETKGAGGFGTVDVAWDNRLQRRVAIKRIPLSQAKIKIPGIQEARTAALLSEPHIVSVIDFEVTSTEALLIMEYVDGPTLSSLLEESTDLLDLDTIAAVVNDVSKALEHAHENQVLHLDIKPDNILINHKGDVKVTDFGLSELSGTVGFSEPQGGTIGYMPPEQIEQIDIDERSDLWALAMLVYLMLTGTNPFQAKNSASSLKMILQEPLTLPSEIHDDLDPSADEIIIKALMADKEDRFSSVAEFSKALMPYLGQPQKGQHNLRLMVGNHELDEVEFSDDWHEKESAEEGRSAWVQAGTAWERTPYRLRGFIARFVAALACGSFAFFGLSAFDMTVIGIQDSSVFFVMIGAIALTAVGAFLAPQLGSALACILFTAGIFSHGLILIGVVLTISLLAWWIFFGRKDHAQSTLVMLTPLLGAFMVSPALPLLSGLFLSWRRALFAGIAQVFILSVIAPLTLSASIFKTGFIVPDIASTSLNDSMLAFFAHPEPWIYCVAFVLAALIMSLCAGKDNRLKSFGGLLASLSILFIACFLVPYLIDFDIYILETMAGLVLSFILLLILLLVGTPTSTKEPEED